MLKKFNCRKAVSIFVLVIMVFNFIDIVSWKRNDILSRKKAPSSSSVDWAKLYPFQGKDVRTTNGTANTPQKVASTGFLEKWRSAAHSITSKEKDLEKKCIYNMFAFHKFVELNGFVNKSCGRIIYPTPGVFLLNNGQWTFNAKKVSAKDIHRTAESISGLANYASSKGIPFLYVQRPEKICKYDPKMPAGAVNYSNQNFDGIIADLKKENVPVFDLREQIHKEGLNHYSLFYRNDHHWTVETALWAAGEIGRKLNSDYSCGLNPAVANRNLYTKRTYKDWFLGSAGQMVSLGCAKPEDFSVLLPDFQTSLQMRIPDIELCKTGEFKDVIYNTKVLNTKDYYNSSCYDTQLYGNHALTQIKNELNPDGPKILVLGDSFCLSMVPYLSLMAKETDLIDFRNDQGDFTGSIRSYIDKMKPDVVLLTYEPHVLYSLK